LQKIYFVISIDDIEIGSRHQLT